MGQVMRTITQSFSTTIQTNLKHVLTYQSICVYSTTKGVWGPIVSLCPGLSRGVVASCWQSLEHVGDGQAGTSIVGDSKHVRHQNHQNSKSKKPIKQECYQAIQL